MGRRCSCDRVEALLEARPWFKALDAGAKWLCFQLVKILAAPSAEGAIPFSDPERVSLLVSMRVTEVETHLETLVQTGLLLRGEGGELTCPALGEAASRSTTARANGARGGRPRKNESPEEARLRRQQTEMIMPIAGRAPKPDETQRWETPSAGARSSSSSRPKNDSVSRVEAWQDVARELIAQEGFTHARLTWIPVKAWMEAGADRELILSTVQDVMAKGKKRPEEITGLGYFDQPIARALAGDVPRTTGAPAEVDYGHAPTDLQRQVEQWQANGCMGPPPWRRVA